MTHVFLNHIQTREQLTPPLTKIPYHYLVCSILFDSAKNLQIELWYQFFYANESFNTNIISSRTLIQEHKDKTINIMVHGVLMWSSQTCLHRRMRENHFTIENIINDITKYDYWIPKTSHVFLLFVFTPYKPWTPRSTKCLPFFPTFISTS